MTSRTLLALAAAALAGCTMGPDFRAPGPPAVATYTAGPQPEATIAADGVAQRFVASRDVPADWWTLYASPKLDALVRRALDASPTLAEARARLAQAQEELAARTSAVTWPSADLSVGVSRNQVDPAALGFPTAPKVGPFTLYHVGIDVSYTADVFGGARRELESLQADVDVRAHELAAAHLALTSNVVTAAVRQAKLRAQIASARAILDAQLGQLKIAEDRYALGGIAAVELANQRALAAQTRATLPPLERDLAHAVHALAVYVGAAPGDAALPPIELAELTLPRDVPLVLPADLVRQRPDIRASEARLHAASAEIGVAEANRYPRLTLSGGLSSDRTRLEDVLGSGINVWNIGFAFVQPLLRQSELRARQRQAIAAYEEALAAHRQVVLTGIANVGDALRALEQDAQAVAATSEQSREADAAYAITLKRYELGGVSRLDVLDAERLRLQAALDRSQAAASRLADTAALLQALGGGWWAARDVGTTTSVAPAPGP
ncbi:MAG: efflux transporter outer membrane subunit [Betaproteobacteria bacterium]